MKEKENIFNSIYVRFIFVFVFILILSNFLAFALMFYPNINEMNQIKEMLTNLPDSRDVISNISIILKKNVVLSTILSSTFTVIVLYIILKPIKKISNATKMIANGNFDMEIRQKKIRNYEVSKLVQNFNKMIRSLKNNEYLHKDFVSSVSHEIKTPITAISGYAELLKDNTISKEQKEEYINIITSESKRLTNLSTNLLKLSELDNKIIYSKSTFCLDEQIRRVVLLLQNKWEQKNIEMNVNLDKVQYLGDEELFELVWINLIGNAIKFTNENGKISIKLNIKDNKILATIKDTGVGIDDKDKEYIFEKFYIADKSRSKESTGLGLSIVKRIIALSDGEVDFESTKGVGTTFYIKLEAE